jgi:hypothetical protein
MTRNSSAVHFAQPVYDALPPDRRADVDLIQAAACNEARRLGYKVASASPALCQLEEAIAQFITNIKDHK